MSLGTLGALRTVFLDQEQEDWRGESAANLDSAVGADSAAYVIYTSGSTGTPKGVVVRHANVASLLAATRESCAPGAADVWTLFHSYAFDFSVWELWGALAYGGQLVVVPYWVSRSPEAFYELLLRERVTVLNQTPAAFRQLLWAAPASPGERRPRPAAGPLRRRGPGAGEPRSLVSPARRPPPGSRQPLRHHRDDGPRHLATSPEAVQAVQAADSASHPAASPIGRPLPGWRALLLDRHFEPVPLGVPGEIHVGGAGLTLGYLGRPELTAERFLPDPFGGEPGGRLYRSGDLARRRPDGGLDYLGRLDHQVKIRGFRIELGEIEAALATHPAVREAVVLAEGEGGDRRLVAYLAGGFGGEGGESAGTGELPSAAALRAWLGATLPAPMVPASYVILDALPLTPNGKVDRRALARLAPAPARAGAEGAFVAPRGPVEEILAEIWADLLGVERVERVGRDDGFFALGGHSLLATQVVSRVRQALGVELPLRQLFEAPTLAGLAAGISSLLPATGAPPLRRLARTGALPLSFAQERLWFLDQLGGTGEAAYNLPLPVRLSGALEPALLAAALGEEVRRHEVLRTTFQVAAGRPVQVVAPALPLALPLVDLADLPGARGESEATRLATAEARRPFDLERGPLLRASLLRLAATEHVLLLTLHHIAADGWSLGVLLGEVAALYGALLSGRPSPLPDLAVQYADYALWQRGWLTGEVLAGELRHWRERLAGAPEVLDLPLDRPRPAVHSFHGGHRSVALPAALAEPLAALSRRSGATLFMTLLAAWKALLARHSGQLDIVVGTPIANRTRTEIEGLIGFFVNTLVLRTDLSGRPGFAGLLSRVRETALAAYSHQELPFEKLVAELTPERHLEHTPLFQVMFVLGERPAGQEESPQLPGLRMSGVETQNRSAKFDLTLIGQRGPLGLDLTLGYNSDLFFASTVERLLGHLLALLGGIVAEPERPVAELPLLSAAELHQLLAGWNDTVGEASPASLHDLFAAQALARPGAVALVSDDALLTYGELDRRAERLAGRLADLGVGPEDRVGIVLERSFELLVAILGVLKAGAAYVPIDPANPRERVLFQLADSKVKVLLSDRRLAGEFAAPLGLEGRPVLCLDEPVGPDETAAEARPRRSAGADGLAYIIYTSGSTGTPNGVEVAHRGAVNLVRQARGLFRVGPESRVLQIASPGFDASVLEIFLALGQGASLCLAREEERLTPAALAATLLRQGVTTAVLTPSLLSVLPEPALAGVSAISVGGEACPGELAVRWASGRRLLNCYGPTEASIFATVEIAEGSVEGGGAPAIGRPVAGAEVYLLDRSLLPVPLGAAGEIAIGGVGVARGYLDRPAKTGERFLPDPWSRRFGARLYRTGDLARRWPDGRLEFLGRIDDQVKVRGFRVELGEIETVLRRHPAVLAAAVLARADARGDRRLVAYVAGDSEHLPATLDLRHFLEERLPAYMVPAQIHRLDALPVTTGGKVDRSALARIADAPEGRERGAAWRAPSDPAERFVAGLWQEVIGATAGGAIGAEDDFFALGGTSIQAAILTNLLQERLGEYVYVVALFDAPTVAQLAQYLRRHYPQALARVAGIGIGIEATAADGGKRVDAEDLLALRRLIPPVSRSTAAAGLPKNPRAAFLLSPPRSGSTLLRVLLAGHPRLFAPPELELLGFATLAEREAAFSGRYALWREGTIRALMEALGSTADAARERLEELARQGRTTRELYREIQAAIGGRTLVDKTPSYALDLATLARAEAEFEAPLYIHLLRHPCGMIASFEKAKLEQVFFRHPHDFASRQLAELIWTVSQENILRFLAGVPAERQYRLRFESLVGEPREELTRLSAFLGLDFDPAMLDPYADGARKMTDGIHALSKMVGDVKFHQHRQVDARVAESWRQDYPEESLGEPTREMAAALGYGRRERQERRPSFSPLVQLAEGAGEPALFLVHPVGGNVLCYRELARHLGGERPVYGLQSLGLGEGLAPQESVEEMAASYVQALREVQPHGPFHLAGWSIGGAVAFEMAQQVGAAGETVDLLALLDTLAPGTSAGRDEEPEAMLLWGLAQDLGGLSGIGAMGGIGVIGGMGLSLERLRELDPESGLAEILEAAERAGALPAGLGQAQAARLWQVYRANVRAVRAYEPRTYAGRLSIFTTRGNPLLAKLGPALGWERVSASGGGGLKVQILATDHYSLLREPAVRRLADRLGAALRRPGLGR